VGAALFVYWPALRGGWLWDDDREITANPALRAASAPWSFWTHPSGTDYWPLKDTAEWGLWKLWGETPVAFHVCSVLLHATAGILFWRILRRIFGAAGSGGASEGLADAGAAALLGALIFVVHPLAVESVAWIAELKNTLSMVFVLAAFLEYLRRRERAAWPRYAASLGLFAAAMLAKSSVVMFPVLLLLFEAASELGTPLRGVRPGLDPANGPGLRQSVQNTVATAPFFAISLLLGLVTYHFQHAQLALPGGDVLPDSPVERAAHAGNSLAFYAKQALWTNQLAPIYAASEGSNIDVSENSNVGPAGAPLTSTPSLHPAGTSAAAGLLVWAVVVGLGVLLWRRRRSGQLLLLAMFVLNLLPVLGFVRIAYFRFSWVADHFAYLSLPAVAAALALLLRLEAARTPLPRYLAATLLVAALGLRARAYARNFRGPTALWSYELARYPSNWAAENNLATALAADGRAADALPHFAAALRLNPSAPEIEADYGATLLQAGQTAAAVPHLLRAVALLPDFAEAQYNLGNALSQLGRFSEAATRYEAAHASEPRSVEILTNLGYALARAGRLDDAVARYRQALELAPSAAPVLDNLGDTELMLHRPDDAMGHFRDALAAAPTDADAEYGWGNALLMKGDPAGAIPHLEAAVRINPQFTAAAENLAAARRALGQ
jgi:tetratricopeptide (TPR) repeat protein